jgi:hypothetical protein
MLVEYFFLIDEKKKKHKKLQIVEKQSIIFAKNRDKTQTFMLQLRVVRAFKSTLEDLEDRRSIHSLRSLRNTQNPGAQTSALSSLFYKNKAFFKINQKLSPQSSPSGNISITVPASLQSEPLNINEINARYMDDDGPEERINSNEQSKETRI